MTVRGLRVHRDTYLDSLLIMATTVTMDERPGVSWAGAVMAKRIIERGFGWRVMPDRVANLTVPHRGRPACHYCDQCQRGCYTASYFNSPSVTLPAAARTRKFTLVSDAVVSHVLMNRRGEAAGVGEDDE